MKVYTPFSRKKGAYLKLIFIIIPAAEDKPLLLESYTGGVYECGLKIHP